MNTIRTSRSVVIVGPLVVLAFCAVTAQVRDQVGATIVGIALAIVVASAALVSRGAGLSTALVAAMAFNFFHTKPYHSLRVHKAGDVAIVALLGLLGLVISDLTAWRQRRDASLQQRDRARRAPLTIGELMAGVHPVSEVWPAVVTSVLDQLGLADCGVVAEQPTNLPLISRAVGRQGDGSDTLVLPAKGAAVPIVSGDKTIGFLVVLPPPGTISLSIERRVIIALADHLAIALTYGDRPLGATSADRQVQ